MSYQTVEEVGELEKVNPKDFIGSPLTEGVLKRQVREV